MSHIFPDSLLTPRLRLRRLQPGDWDALCSYRSLPAVARYQGWESFGREDARRLIESQREAQPGVPGTWFQVAMVDRATQVMIGDCGLHCLRDEPQQMEFGITLAPGHQGRGYATEALEGLLHFAFATLGMHRVLAVTGDQNLAAASLFRRLGFRQEAHHIEHRWYKGYWDSEFVFALLRREWRRACRKGPEGRPLNLQFAMTPHQIAQTYDRLASFWDSEEFHRANGLAQHRRALQFVPAAEAGDWGEVRQALDVGCGSSGRILDLLLEAGFETEGVDISAEMIRLARVRHPGVRFHEADVCTWELSKRYDFISAWDSIWHAPLAAQEALLKKLCEGLKPGGVLIFTCGGLDESGEKFDDMMGQPVYHATLGLPKILETVAHHACLCRHLEYDQHPEPHVYLIVQRSA